ncbi:MAG: hypothetical protein JRN68_07585 [Nitrososphaerota archaeon]|nr:hypothetical protein [Nitrososphaerota archaeon]
MTSQQQEGQSLEKREKEVLWFSRKYLGLNEENWGLFLKHITPEDVSKILKWAMKEGMALTWEDAL